MTKETMTSRRLTLILILGSLAALGPLSIDMYLPAFPDMSRSFDASASLIQLSLTACMLGMALGQLIVGPLSDVRGRKRPLMVALLAYLLASLACAMAPTIEVLIALRFIQGAAGASGIVISRAIVRDLFDGPELTRFLLPCHSSTEQHQFSHPSSVDKCFGSVTGISSSTCLRF